MQTFAKNIQASINLGTVGAGARPCTPTLKVGNPDPCVDTFSISSEAINCFPLPATLTCQNGVWQAIMDQNDYRRLVSLVRRAPVC